jgi:hypothetical protein
MQQPPGHQDHKPTGGGLGPNEPYETVDVTFNLLVSREAGRATLRLLMSAPHHPDAVVTLPDGSQQLAVPPGALRLFRITLSSAWDWKFDVSADIEGAPVRFKDHGHAGFYHIAAAGDRAIGLIGRSTVSADYAGPGKVHPFNLYVQFLQPGGLPPLRLRVDPDGGNPPPKL